MNKINRVERAQDTLQVVKSTRGECLAGDVLNHKTTSPKSSQINQPTRPIFYDLSLRHKIEAIQKAKKDLCLETEAATDPATAFAVVGGGIALGKAIHGLIIRYQKNKKLAEIARLTEKGIESLGKNFESLSIHNDSERYDAIKNFTKADLENPTQIINDVNEAISAYLNNYSYILKEDEPIVKATIRGFFAALEALYQRSDVQSVNWKRIAQYLEQAGKIPLLDSTSIEHMSRILVRNWKVPVEDKIPNPDSKTQEYRTTIYTAMLKTLVESNELTNEDPLFLRTDASGFSEPIKSKSEELRKALVKALTSEIECEKKKKSQYSYAVVKLIEAILSNATQIPKEEWNQAAKDKKVLDEANRCSCIKFKDWASSVTGMSQTKLEECFEHLVSHAQTLVKGLDKLKDLNKMDHFDDKPELNKGLSEVLNLVDKNPNWDLVKLSEKNAEMGLFMFRYLNSLLENEVSIGGKTKSAFKNHLSEENKDRLLKICHRVVHDEVNFPSTARDHSFFAKPLLNSVPGQALSLYHKLTRCFNTDEGYVDVHGVKELVLDNAAHNLSPTVQKGEALTSGFLFSGPPGTGKSFFAEALANQLAVPLFRLNPSMLAFKRGNLTVDFNGERMPLGEFFEIIKGNSPCVLLLDDVDALLPPREIDRSAQDDNKIKDKKDNSTPTGIFLPEIQNIRNESGAKVVLIMTTNFPPSGKINLAQLDEKGYSIEGYKELCRYVSRAAIRRQRVDYKVFTFHKFFDEKQGEAFAKRFIGPYIRAGKISGNVDYAEAGKIIMRYTPATVETVFSNVISRSKTRVTQEKLLAELQKEPSMYEGRANPEIALKIQSKVTILVAEETKSLAADLDFDELAIAAASLDYNSQIRKALEELTPRVLTQGNILAAFEKVRKQKN